MSKTTYEVEDTLEPEMFGCKRTITVVANSCNTNEHAQKKICPENCFSCQFLQHFSHVAELAYIYSINILMH